MKQPIASPIHPAALERSIPESECFFWRAHQPRTCLSPPCLALTPPSRHLLHRQAAHPQRRLLSRRAARRRIGRPRCRGGARRRSARGGAPRLSEGAAHRPAHRARRQRRQGLTDVDGPGRAGADRRATAPCMPSRHPHDERVTRLETRNPARRTADETRLRAAPRLALARWPLRPRPWAWRDLLPSPISERRWPRPRALGLASPSTSDLSIVPSPSTHHTRYGTSRYDKS